MHAPAFLTELVAVFGVAVVVVLVLSRFRLPTIAGFIVAGALIGPSGFALVGGEGEAGSKQIESLAEVGVVLLLFTIGLEFSLARLRTIWRTIALGGGLQVSLTIGAVLGVCAAVVIRRRARLFDVARSNLKVAKTAGKNRVL